MAVLVHKIGERLGTHQCLADVAVVVETINPSAIARPRHAPVAGVHARHPEPFEHLAVPVLCAIEVDIESMHEEHILCRKLHIWVVGWFVSSRKIRHRVFIGTANADKTKHIIHRARPYRKPARIHIRPIHRYCHLHSADTARPRFRDKKAGVLVVRQCLHPGNIYSSAVQHRQRSVRNGVVIYVNMRSGTYRPCLQMIYLCNRTVERIGSAFGRNLERNSIAPDMHKRIETDCYREKINKVIRSVDMIVSPVLHPHCGIGNSMKQRWLFPNGTRHLAFVHPVTELSPSNICLNV